MPLSRHRATNPAPAPTQPTTDDTTLHLHPTQQTDLDHSGQHPRYPAHCSSNTRPNHIGHTTKRDQCKIFTSWRRNSPTLRQHRSEQHTTPGSMEVRCDDEISTYLRHPTHTPICQGHDDQWTSHLSHISDTTLNHNQQQSIFLLHREEFL